MHQIIRDNLDALRELSVQFNIERLEVYGVAVTESFDTDTSPIHLFFEFDPERFGDSFIYSDFLNAVESLLSCEVDLTNVDMIRELHEKRLKTHASALIYSAS